MILTLLCNINSFDIIFTKNRSILNLIMMQSTQKLPQFEKAYTLNPQKQLTFLQSNSGLQKSYSLQGNINDPNHIDHLDQLSDKFINAKSIMDQQQNSELEEKSVKSLGNETLMKEQIQNNMKSLEKLWEYRYVCLVNFALKTNNWFRLFSFLSEFKQKSIFIVKDLIHKGLQNAKTIDQIDYRYNLKNHGEEGIYFVDGIIVRIAKIKGTKNQNGEVFDYNAVKALHQEFLSHNIINNLSLSLIRDMPKLPQIRVPLTCLVRYLGYTALCQADSPCQGIETLVHGPTGSIYQYRQEYMNMLRIIGKSLNLKEFTMLSSDKKSVMIPFSLTVQLHKVAKHIPHERILSLIHPQSILYPANGSILLDQPEYYLMNISKLWPLFIDSDIIKSVGYLRPEVVISSKSPLSNVVFCQISEKPDPQGQLELADACKKVKEDHISNLAKMLDNTTIFIVDSQGIEDIMHEYGINMRYIGSLAEKVNLEFNKKILETEMIARACKRYFFKTFHDISHQKRFVSHELINEFKECFVDFLNLLFIKTKQGQNFYKKFIYTEVIRYYDYKITAYPPQLQGGGILHALCYHFGVKLKIINYPFFQDLESIFNFAHILQVHGSAKVYDMDTTEIKQICKRYKEKRRAKKLDECIKELKILSKINSIANTEKTQPIGPLPESYFLTELSEVYFRMGDVQNAQKYAEMALKAIPQKHSDAIRPFQILLKLHSLKKQMNKSVQYYEKSLNYLGYHLGTNHPMLISVYNSLAYQLLQTTDPTKCQKMFLRSLQICERSLGYTHATSSQILLQLAQLPLSIEKKINYFMQGLNVLENLDNGQQYVDKAKRVCMKISQMYYKLGNLQKMIFFAKKCNYWEMQIIGESKLRQHKNVLVLANRVPISNQECIFLISYAFGSYMRMLGKVPKDNLYKLFVSLKDYLSSDTDAVKALFERLKIDRTNSMTITQFLRNTFNNVIQEIPQLIQKPNFYRRILSTVDVEDRKLKYSIESFIDIASIVGQQKCEKILTEFVRNE